MTLFPFYPFDASFFLSTLPLFLDSVIFNRKYFSTDRGCPPRVKRSRSLLYFSFPFREDPLKDKLARSLSARFKSIFFGLDERDPRQPIVKE